MRVYDTFETVGSAEPAETKCWLTSIAALTDRITISLPEKTVGSSVLLQTLAGIS